MFCPFVFWLIVKKYLRQQAGKKGKNLKRKILTAVLTITILGGILTGVVTVQAKEVRLTFNCDVAGKKEKSVIDKLLSEYTEKTGILVETVSGEADICIDDFAGVTEQYRKGSIVNLYPYMEKKSSYSRTVSWGETLPEEIREKLQIYKREIPGYPASRSVVRMFCNEDLFEKAGVEIPNIWAEFIEICKQFREQGMTPLIFPEKDSKSPVWQWVMNYLCSQMDLNLADSLDETEDRYVELAEACKGTDKEIIDYTQPQMQVALQCLKELFDLSAGNDMGYEESLKAFAQGETPLIFATSEDDEKLKGEFLRKAVPFPAVTEETSEYAAGKQILAGGDATTFYAVNSMLIDNKERLEAAVDFVRYMTSEKTQEKMAFEAGVLPSVKEITLPEEMKDFKVVEEPLRMAYFTGLDEINQTEIWSFIREYLNDEMDIAVLTERLNQSCQEAAKRIREENGWTLVNNYGMPTTGECTKCAP